MMEETIEHGGNGGAVAEQFAPVVYGPVRSQQSTGALMRRITISSKSSAAVIGNFRIPRSSMIKSGTETNSSMVSLRVPSMTAWGAKRGAITPE